MSEELITRLNASVSMSMFATKTDLYMDILQQRKDAAFRIEELEKDLSLSREWEEKYKGDLDVMCRWHEEETARSGASQARLSEAVKVLEDLGTAVSIYRLGVNDTVPKIAAGDHGDMATIKALMANNDILDASLSKARQFLATLGEENDR